MEVLIAIFLGVFVIITGIVSYVRFSEDMKKGVGK